VQHTSDIAAMDVTDELLLRERRDGDDDDVAWTGRGEPPWLTAAELNGSLLLPTPPSGAAANRRFMATRDAYSVSFESFRGFGYGSEDTI
jgi:hypothetical protein